MKPMATKLQKDEDGMIILPVRKRNKDDPSSNTLIGWGCVISVIALAVMVETGVWNWVLSQKF